jgi:acetolactate synthase-1/2/3 large subunit
MATAHERLAAPTPERQPVPDPVSTAELMARYLTAAGIRHLFGYPGDPNIEFLEAARREGIEMILGRREGTVAFMAEAYGMLTRRPGVCVSTLGPGSTSLVNGVATAFLDRVPMLAISGQVGTRLEQCFTHQVIDHNRLFSPITKWTARMVPEAAGTIMRKAFRTATAERPGPVHLTTNGNVLTQPAADATVDLPPWAAVQLPQVFASDGDSGAVLRHLARARRPIVLAGIAAQRAGATDALVAFAEAIGCPVVVSPMAKGLFPEDHALYASTIDMACNKVVWDFLAGADLIIAVGFDGVELIKPWALSTPVLHIDSTPNTDQIYFADVEVVGHIPSVLRALVDSHRGEPRWTEHEVAAHREVLRATFYHGRVAGKLNPTDIVDAVNDVFSRDTIVTTDVGSHKLLIGQGWRATRPNGFLMTNGLSSMGFALPAAITAKLLHPDRPVVCTIGDGGFAMVQSELRLASSLGLGIVVVVFCDNSLNRIELKQIAKGYPSVLTRLETTDLERLAASMDCDGVRVDSQRQLHAALRGAGDVTRPLVVEAQIDPAQYVSQF